MFHQGNINRLILSCIFYDPVNCNLIIINLNLGLKTALVELDDFSSGTSSRSTKLIHGGVRYLQKAILQLDFEQVNISLWI